MARPIGPHPVLYLKIANGQDLGGNIYKFEWSSFTNGGYIIKGEIRDANWKILKDIATEYYLENARKKPTPIIFELSWNRDPQRETGKHLAYATALRCKSAFKNRISSLEFEAMDPPSYFLNTGDSSGKVYKGKVSQVIKKVVEEYCSKGNVEVEVSDTDDYDGNYWPMMRQDPKTFISSLIEWSSGVTKKKTNWIVSCGGAIESKKPTIWIKEQAERKSENFGAFTHAMAGGNHVIKVEMLADNFISVFNKQLITHGISTVSEKYLDRKSTNPPHTGKDSQCVVHVHDENTPNKKNVDIRTGFERPENPDPDRYPHEWSTSIPSVPEIYSSQDIGMTYDKYIDGVARQMYLNMLNAVMKIKLTCFGIPDKKLANSHNLGVSKLNLIWKDSDGENYFLAGDWLVYGFHHTMTVSKWHTDLYCYRLDQNATAQKV